MKRITFIGMTAVVLAAQGAGSLWASGAGTTGADILNIGVGARAIAMGEAYIALADDASSLYWNPAGLALMQERQASFMYSQQLEGLAYQNARIGIPLENGAIGGSLSYLSYGQIDGFDQFGNSIGNQKAYSGVGTLGAAWLGNQWSVGVNAKGIQETLADESASTFAFDFGTTVIYPKPVLGGTIRAAAVVQNVGSGMKFLQQTDPLPMKLKLGLAAVQMMDHHLNLTFDITKPNDGNATYQGGAEYWLGEHLALRTGYAVNQLEGMGVRAGIGLRLKSLSFDYAYAGFGELGITHRYEISFRFGEPRPVLTSEEYKILKEAKAAIRQERYEQAMLLLDSLIRMEPRYKKAQRLSQYAMAKLDTQQKMMLAKQGTNYQPTAANAVQKQNNMSELDELEALLSITTPKAAQAPQPQAVPGDPSSDTTKTEVR